MLSNSPDDTRGSSRHPDTQTITRCHTRKWPVARYVNCPIRKVYSQIVTCNIRPGNVDESGCEEKHRAEQLDNTLQMGRGGGRADQNAEQAEQEQAEPELGCMTKTPRYDQLQPARIGKETSNNGMYVLRCGQAEMQNCGDEQSSYERGLDRAEPRSNSPDDTRGSSRHPDTQTITRCHTRKWPVARYVECPIGNVNNQIVTCNIHSGNVCESGCEEKHRAEQMDNTLLMGRGGGQADQNAEQAEQVQAEPEFVAGLGGVGFSTSSTGKFYQLHS